MRRERRVRGLQNGWGGAVGFALLGCSDPPPPEPDASPAAARDFGVLLVDVGYDDPTDPAPVTSYLDEVRAFSTFGDIFDPDPGRGADPERDLARRAGDRRARRSDVSGDLDPGRRGLGAANGRLDR